MRHILTVIIIGTLLFTAYQLHQLNIKNDYLIETYSDYTIQLKQTELQLIETELTVKHFMDALGIEPIETSAYAPWDNISGICTDGYPDMTATGTKTRVGVLAVDPKTIPYGTKIFIPNYGWGVAEDYCPYYVQKGVKGIDKVVMTYREAINDWPREIRNVLVVEQTFSTAT